MVAQKTAESNLQVYWGGPGVSNIKLILSLHIKIIYLASLCKAVYINLM